MRPNKPAFQRVRVPPAQIAQSAPQSYLTPGGGDLPGESSGVKVSATGRNLRSVRPGGEQSTRPYAKANRLSPVRGPHPGLREQEASADGGKVGSAEPLNSGRRLTPAEKNWVSASVGLLGVGEDGMVERNDGERGKGSVPAKTVLYCKDLSYNRKTGSRGEEPSLAAEGVVVMTPMDNTTSGERRPSGQGWSRKAEGPRRRASSVTWRRRFVNHEQQDEHGRHRAGRLLARGNTAADMPLPLAGRTKSPCPVGWGRAGNGRKCHGLGEWAPASETPGLCARDLPHRVPRLPATRSFRPR